MKKNIAILLFILFASCSTLLAQVEVQPQKGWIVGPAVSYQYQSKNMLKLSFWGLTDLGFMNYLKVDANADFAWKDSKTYVIPEIGVTYYMSPIIMWPYVKAEITPYTISPKVGVGVFNLLDVGVGYGWSLQERKGLGKIEGINVSVTASLPLNFFF